MSKISILFGSLLLILGPVGYFVFPSLLGIPGAEVKTSWTAFIPSIIGGILLICGLVVMAKPELRKHVMHVAALIGLIGFFGSMGGILALVRGAGANPPVDLSAPVSKTILAVLCLIYVGLCVKSFIDARRARTAMN